MTTLYKLTDADMRTHNGFQWKLNVRAKATGERDQGLCSSEFIHVYEHAEIAHVLNPIHANYAKPRLFRAEGKIEARDGQLKVGVRSLVLREEIVFQAPTTTQRVAFAVYCAKKVCRDQKWVAWADKWLSGEDRAPESAAWAASWAPESAAWAAARAAWAAAWAAESAAAWAARSAAWAAESAAWAASWAPESAESAPFSLRDCAIRALAFEVGELK